MSQKDHFRRIHGGCRLIEVCLAPKVLMTWGIDTVIPMRAHETHGEGWDRMDCMRQPKGSAYSLPPDRTARAENTAKRLSHLNNLAKAIEDKQQFPLCSFVNIL